MDLETALKTIAFYDGYRDAFNPCGGNYLNQPELMEYYSIDKLIHIWQKMKQFGITLRFDETEYHNVYFLIDNVGDEYARTMNKELTLKDSIVIATAMAIDELEER